MGVRIGPPYELAEVSGSSEERPHVVPGEPSMAVRTKRPCSAQRRDQS
jgi:hypothetical protein